MKGKTILILLVITLISCNNMNLVEIPLSSIFILDDNVTIVEGETITIDVEISPIDSTELLYFSYSTLYVDVSMIDRALTITGKKAGSTNITVKNKSATVSTSIALTITPKQYSLNQPIININGLSAVVESVFHRRNSAGEILSNSTTFPGQILQVVKIVFDNNSDLTEYVSSSYFGLTNGSHQINTINYLYNYDQNGNSISTNVAQTIQPGARYTMYIGFEPTDTSLLLEDYYILNFNKFSMAFKVKFTDQEIE